MLIKSKMIIWICLLNTVHVWTSEAESAVTPSSFTLEMEYTSDENEIYNGSDFLTTSAPTEKKTLKPWSANDYIKSDPEAIKRRLCLLMGCTPQKVTKSCINFKCTEAQIVRETETFAERQAEFERTLFSRVNKMHFGIIISIFSLIFIFGVFGNVMIMLVTLLGKGLTNSTNIFITSMAVADMLVLFVCLPVWSMEFLLDYWLLGRELCRIVLYIRSTSFVVSVLHLVCMCLDRYLAICHPMKAKVINTVGRARIIAIATWLIGGALASPTAIYSGLFVLNATTKRCVILLPPEQWGIYLYRFYYFLAVFIIPVSVLCFGYGRVIVTLLQSIKVNAQMKGDDGKKEKPGEKQKVAKEAKSRLQVVKMLVAVLVAFSMCWGPALLWDFVRHGVRLNNYIEHVINFGLTTLAYANSSISPAIYFIMSKKYRAAMVALLCCRKEEKYAEKSSAVTRESNVSSSVNSVAA